MKLHSLKGDQTTIVVCLEVQRGRRVEGNGSPLPYLDVFKISKEEGSN